MPFGVNNSLINLFYFPEWNTPRGIQFPIQSISFFWIEYPWGYSISYSIHFIFLSGICLGVSNFLFNPFDFFEWNTLSGIQFPIQSILFFWFEYPYGYSISYSIHFNLMNRIPLVSSISYSIFFFWIEYPSRYSISYSIHFIFLIGILLGVSNFQFNPYYFFESNTVRGIKFPIQSIFLLNWIPLGVFKFPFNPFYSFEWNC